MSSSDVQNEMPSLAERIRAIRTALHMTREAFGEKIGIPGRTIEGIETEGRIPRGDVLEGIAKAFPQYAYWLLTLDSEGHSHVSPLSTCSPGVQQHDAGVSVVVDKVLVEKIVQLERVVINLQLQLEKARAHSIESLKFLRLHQAVVLFTGDDIEKFNETISDQLGSDYLNSLSCHMFSLSHAPLSKNDIDTFRAAFKGCQVKW